MYPKSLRFTSVQYCNCSMKLPQSCANSLPSLGNRLGLNIRSQSYPKDFAFSSVSASICYQQLKERATCPRCRLSRWKLNTYRMPTRFRAEEGDTTTTPNASGLSVLRSLRTRARRETTCPRTGRSPVRLGLMIKVGPRRP